MEATSARMASRYQFDGFTPPKSALQRYIYNACDPAANFEPNLALNLEVIDLINSKKGGAPREAAITVVQIINHRNPNVSLLALALLDICVKNCGYPFHLQISTKEFLNELVRRFPERPPARPSRVMNRILEAIEEWRQTICQTSRYKEDLGFIRDMHRLLLFKGYMFPEVRREDAAVLNPSDNLQSAEEMEEEERAAQAAKLQELIRRGTPADLQEANRLMKVMAGYDTRHKTNYRAKAAEEVSKVQQKAKILEEMLQGQKEGDKIADGDVFEELVGALQSAHPKIQKMCEEESDDQEAVAKLLEINDSIHRTIERYKLMKAGNIQAANSIAKGTLGTTFGVGKNAANELSLIDFDAEPSAGRSTSATSNGDLLAGVPAASSTQAASVEDDLLGLSLDDGGPKQPQAISLGGPSGFGASMPPSFYSSSPAPQVVSVTPLSPPQSQVATPATKANYDAFSSLSNAFTPPKAPINPQSTSFHQQAPLQSNQTAPRDPFASLVASSSRPGTPGQQRSVTPAGSKPTLANLAQNRHASPAPPAAPAPAATSTAAKAEDDWNFTSALPNLPTFNRLVVHSSNVKIEFVAQRTPNKPEIRLKAAFSNQTSQPIGGLHFQVAVRGYSLQLKPQSGQQLNANQSHGVQQEMTLSNIPEGQGNVVRMRFKLSYQLNGQPTEEQGEVPALGIL